MRKIIELVELEKAAQRLHGQAVHTPLLESPQLNQDVGARVLIKPEMLQRSGSFKFRGAFNRLCQLRAAERVRGCVAFSSGNHAQGVAAAAEILSMPATIVMPSDAPRVKLDKTKSYGAEVVTYDRFTESREDIAKAIADDQSAVLVPSYDDYDIITGQGTVGLEIAHQAVEMGAQPDILLCCVGGGGLIAGTASACSALMPETVIYGVEPVGFDDHRRSLASGQREQISADARSICDALLTPTPGELTFAINRHLLAGCFAVTDDEVRTAMRYAYSVLKLVVEPGGAVALAALLAGKVQNIAGQTVALILSGGNVDPAQYADVITDML